MKTKLSLTVMGVMLVLTLGLMSASQSGSIWTTTDSCGEDQQNVNEYFVGQIVYINGANFNPGTYDWDISKVSGSEKPQIASGSVTPDTNGNFCFAAHTIQEGESGVYQAKVDGNKNDNYHVGSIIVPEFGTTVGILTTLGALGVFFLVRRK